MKSNCLLEEKNHTVERQEPNFGKISYRMFYPCFHVGEHESFCKTMCRP